MELDKHKAHGDRGGVVEVEGDDAQRSRLSLFSSAMETESEMEEKARLRKRKRRMNGVDTSGSGVDGNRDNSDLDEGVCELLEIKRIGESLRSFMRIRK